LSLEVTEIKETWPKAALTLAGGGSNTDAAKAAGVSKRTVLRWRADEVMFADQVETIRSEMLTEAAGLLAHTTAAAAGKLAEIIESGDDRHALTASRIVLEMASRYRIDQALEHRISSLEIAAGLRQGGS
jgi:hypothetical protein